MAAHMASLRCLAMAACWYLMAVGAHGLQPPGQALVLVQVHAELRESPAHPSATHHFRNKAAAKLDVRAETTTPNPFRKGATAAEMTGVQENAAGDLEAFLAALITNVVMFVGMVVGASFLRKMFPIVYSGRAIQGDSVPFVPEDTLFGWATASCRLTIDEIQEYSGLDQAMLMEFSQLAMKMLLLIGLPMLVIMGTCHCFFGGNRSGDDKLSKLGMANVVDEHPWLYWAHAGVAWIVIVSVQTMIFNAQRSFLARRIKWLKAMPKPRSCTILVENIPDEQCADIELASFFNNVFGPDVPGGVVEAAHMVKTTTNLGYLVNARDTNKGYLEEAEFKLKQTGERPQVRFLTTSEDAIDYYKKEIKEADKKIAEEQKEVMKEAKTAGGVNTSNAFVTFKNMRMSEIALKASITPNEEEFVCSIPPDPSDVIWTDFQQDPNLVQIKSILGYALVAGVFWVYMPLVVFTAALVRTDNVVKLVPAFSSVFEDPSLCAMWDGMMGSLMLQLIISFVPTFFVLIFYSLFVLKAQAWLQHRIQQYYFYFLVVFVLLVTAVGSSLMGTLKELSEDPLSIFALLAATMPTATHFYLNYLPLQWVTHAQNSLRMVQLFKYQSFKVIFEEDAAKRKAEPEDQDYYGIGSRSSRFAFLLTLPLVFCSLTPLITILGFLNFASCRVIYGYLTTFAEIRKPDLGGVFWCTQLRHVQQGMFIYLVVMTGVLLERDTTIWPGTICAAAFAWQLYTYSRFNSVFRWEHLCLQDVGIKMDAEQKKPVGSYVQPELVA